MQQMGAGRHGGRSSLNPSREGGATRWLCRLRARRPACHSHAAIPLHAGLDASYLSLLSFGWGDRASVGSASGLTMHSCGKTAAIAKLLPERQCNEVALAGVGVGDFTDSRDCEQLAVELDHPTDGPVGHAG